MTYAKKTKEIVASAEGFLENLEAYCACMPAEGVPRSGTMSTRLATDDVKHVCPYCGIHIQKTTRGGLWTVDIPREPWKAECPKCHSKFPSNDFALLYQRGLNEKGEYDRTLAVRRNQEAVERGEKDALVNELFPDKDANWMVDDGFGWSGKDGTYGTLDLSKWAPVAYWHHMFWYSNRMDTGSVSKAIETLSKAYTLTGEEKYAQAGIRLLHKVADVYPSYYFPKVGIGYSASHGSGYNGKTIGSIWEHFLAERLLRAYIALEERMDAPTRAHIQENIVRESFRAVKEGTILGNFGMQQKVAALVARALDDEKEIEEVLTWLCNSSKQDFVPYVDPIYGLEVSLRQNNTGGELLEKYVDEIDHDGFGGEVSISYNRIWHRSSIEVAEILKECKINKLDLYQNPRFLKMFQSFIKETVADGVSLAIGDSGHPANGLISCAGEVLRGYAVTKDPKLAQAYDYYVDGDLSKEYLEDLTPAQMEALIDDIRKDVQTHGRLQWESENLTGFGLAVLREGDHKKATPKQYDTWMYYGRSLVAHSHADMLQLGIDAYGFNMGPDLGYPEATGSTPNRIEWIRATISHNTVVVNGESQKGAYVGKPLHFDSTDRVKLMDVDGSVAYDATDIYRRTAVTIAADDTIGYTLDFFRIKGGESHSYGLHTQSYLGYHSDDVNWIPQVDENGNYVGTYAGADVPYGKDPYSTDTTRAENPKYPRGYTWLTHINKGSVKSGHFSVDFAQTDFRNQAPENADLHLKYTALNDWIPDNVDMTVGHPQRKVINEMIPGLDYMFIHRRGENLDTLYTSLLEPYKGESYIEQASSVDCKVKAGVAGENDVVKAVKVQLKNSRTDYVVYATNSGVTYTVTDGDITFDFAGFVGVYSVDESGKCVYSYVNDGTRIGDVVSVGAYTGIVTDFTKELVKDNCITICPDQALEDLSVLKNQYIYMDSKSKRNAVYRILGAEKVGDKIVLNLGNCSVIDCYKDPAQTEAGYLYTIEEGQPFQIPVSASQVRRPL